MAAAGDTGAGDEEGEAGAWAVDSVSLEDLEFSFEADEADGAESSTAEHPGATSAPKGRAETATAEPAEAEAEAEARSPVLMPRFVMPGRVIHFQIPTRPATVEAIQREADHWFDEWQEAVLMGKPEHEEDAAPGASAPPTGPGSGRAAASGLGAPSGFEVGVAGRRSRHGLTPPTAPRVFWGKLCSDYPVVVTHVDPGDAESHLTELRATVYARADHTMSAMQHCIAASL
jgi:hypothetical protein